MFFIAIKLVFISCLFLIFLKYFGYPSYRRYHKKDTVFSENQVSVDHTKPLMVTIYAWKDKALEGWKELPNGYTNLREIYNSTDGHESLIECITNKTYKHEDIISRSTTGDSHFHFHEEIDVTNMTSWTQGITTFKLGMFHSLKIFPTIFPEEQSEQEWQISVYLKTVFAHC